MQRLRAMGYAARRGAMHIGRTPVTTAAVACAIACSVLAIGVLRLADANLLERSSMTSGAAAIVYLAPGVDVERASAIGSALDGLEGTSEVRIVSPAEAKARLEIELAADAAALADLDATFFPTTIELALRPGVSQAAPLHPFVERLERIEDVESVDVLDSPVDRASMLLSSIQTATHILSLVFTACAIFIVVVLIRGASSRARQERDLYIRLGATPAFAVAPELVAGALRGLIGGVCATASIFALYVMLGPSAEAALAASLDAPSLRFLPATEIVLLPIGGAMLGVIGAAIAGGRRG